MSGGAPKTLPPEQVRAAFADAIDRFDRRPKLVVDDDQHVLWCCEDTATLLGSAMPICVRNGNLVIEDEEVRNAFPDFLHAVGPQVQHKLIRGKSPRHWVMVRAWRPAEWRAKVCLLCTLSLPTTDVATSGLAGELRLTRSEARVLGKFAELHSPKQIAGELGVSLSTVRSHLKQIHAKAGVTSSMQLLRLAHTFCSG